MKVYEGTRPSSIIIFLAMFSFCISLITLGVSSLLTFLFFSIFILLLSYTVILKIKEEKNKQDEYEKFPKIRKNKFAIALSSMMCMIILMTYLTLSLTHKGNISLATIGFLSILGIIYGMNEEIKDFNQFRNKIATLAQSSKPDDARSD